YGTRTRVLALRGLRPRPLDEGSRFSAPLPSDQRGLLVYGAALRSATVPSRFSNLRRCPPDATKSPPTRTRAAGHPARAAQRLPPGPQPHRVARRRSSARGWV